MTKLARERRCFWRPMPFQALQWHVHLGECHSKAEILRSLVIRNNITSPIESNTEATRGQSGLAQHRGAAGKTRNESPQRRPFQNGVLQERDEPARFTAWNRDIGRPAVRRARGIEDLSYRGSGHSGRGDLPARLRGRA